MDQEISKVVNEEEIDEDVLLNMDSQIDNVILGVSIGNLEVILEGQNLDGKF